MQALRVYDAIVVFNDDTVRSMTSHSVLLWLNGDYGLASAVSVILLGFIALFALVISLLTRREKRKPSKLKSKNKINLEQKSDEDTEIDITEDNTMISQINSTYDIDTKISLFCNFFAGGHSIQK